MYTKRVYPILVARLGNPKPIQVLRRRMLAKADGAVLELGFGSGVNLDYYDSEKITRLYALEPNQRMTEIAEKHLKRAAFHITFLDLPGEQIPLADRFIDTVVTTLRCVRSRIARRYQPRRRRAGCFCIIRASGAALRALRENLPCL